MHDFLLFLFDLHHLLFLGIGATIGYAVGSRKRRARDVREAELAEARE